MNHFPESCFPNAEQKLLLDACLLQGSPAIQACEEWGKRTGFIRIDYGSFKLIPLLYKNMSEQGARFSFSQKLKGLYRYSWVKNSRIFAQLKKVLESFEAAGVPTLLVKGASLSLFTYRDKGAHYMDDADVLVPLDYGERALKIMMSDGWTQNYGTPVAFKAFNHAINLFKKGCSIDLHWHLLNQCCSPEDSLPFWELSQPVEALGTATRILSPTDQLFQVCIHGTRWGDTSPIRWVADAAWILQIHAANLDWNRIVEHARRLRLSLQLESALRYLAEHYSANIPETALDLLRRMPKEKWELREFASEMRPRPWLSEFPLLWHRYERTGMPKKYRLKIWGFLKYVQNYVGLEKARDLPIFLGKRFLQRTRKRHMLKEEKA